MGSIFTTDFAEFFVCLQRAADLKIICCLRPVIAIGGPAAQRSLPQKFGGGQSGDFLEQAAEMVGVCEAEQTRRFSHA